MGFVRQRIGFLGAGQMAQALARGWLAADLLAPAGLAASDPHPAARETFAQETGSATTANNLDILPRSDVLFLAVKPQMMPTLLAEIAPAVEPRHLVVSIAAGVSLATLRAGLGTGRLVRAMPNTPCLVGASATAYTPGDGATPEDGELLERLFGAVGRVVRLNEGLLDAVTGLSGSGPAFVYVTIEALADGGVRMGLPRDVALTLAAQTVLGAARMVLETGTHPGLLKDRVASPAGTTIAGLHALERAGVRGAFMDAVEAATLRARELARPTE
jgi:pyrroline-5-carboxylate reductase